MPNHLSTSGDTADLSLFPQGQLTQLGQTEETRIRIRDFESRQGVSLTINDDQLTPDDTLIRGRFLHRSLRDGLSLHCSDTREEHAFSTDSSHDAGLSCIFFVKGSVDVSIGNQDFFFRPSLRTNISAAGLIKREQEPFRRATAQAQDVRHLVVTASPQWLAESGFEDSVGEKLKRQLNRDNIAGRQWAPSARLATLIQDVFSMPPLAPALQHLQLEARSIDIVAETLTAILQGHNEAEPCQQAFRLNRHDSLRLRRAQELIASDPGRDLSVDLIAREAGISSSGLQRLFRRAENCSVFDYVRDIRLKQAKSLLNEGHSSIQEVSSLTGFKSPANFATAFKRRFGITPSQAIENH